MEMTEVPSACISLTIKVTLLRPNFQVVFVVISRKTVPASFNYGNQNKCLTIKINETIVNMNL